jgi:hypothetical protein
MQYNVSHMKQLARNVQAKMPTSSGIGGKIVRGYTKDIIREIEDTFNQRNGQAAAYAPDFLGSSLEATLYNLWLFTRLHITYRQDPEGWQYVPTPARVWINKAADCKGMAIFIGSVLANLRIPFSFRFVEWEKGKNFKHVYIVVPRPGGGEYVLDATMPRFNTYDPYVSKMDIPTNIQRIEGRQRISGPANVDPIERIINADFTTLTSGELDVMLLDAQLETMKGSPAISGPGDLTYEGIKDAQELLREGLALMAERNEPGLNAWKAAIKGGLYDVAGMAVEAQKSMGGNAGQNAAIIRDGVRQLRRDQLGAMCRCAATQQGTGPAKAVQQYQIKNLDLITGWSPETVKAMRPILQMRCELVPLTAAVADSWNSDYSRAEIGLSFRLGSIGTFINDAANNVSNAVDGIRDRVTDGVNQVITEVKNSNPGQSVSNLADQLIKRGREVALAPLRAALELLLKGRIALFFIYLFLTDEQAAKAPAKVQRKRNEQIKIFKSFCQILGFSEDQLKKIIRVGIQNFYKRTPEEVLTGMARGGRPASVGAGAPMAMSTSGGTGSLSVSQMAAMTPEGQMAGQISQATGIQPEQGQGVSAGLADIVKEIVGFYKFLISKLGKKPEGDPEQAAPSSDDWPAPSAYNGDGSLADYSGNTGQGSLPGYDGTAGTSSDKSKNNMGLVAILVALGLFGAWKMSQKSK